MTLLVTPAQAISDPNLLGNGFRGPSWNRWRACLKAIFGERLTKAERVLFSEVAERSSPRRPVREAWFLCGRRAGKDSIAAACATIIAAGDYRQFLRPGEVATVACLAVSKDQARIVLNYIRANFLTCPMLAPKVVRETDNGLELNNQVEIVVLANNFRSVRGKTVLACIFDEIALWRDETAAYPDAETYSAIRPAMATLPDALLIAITTVYRKAGLYYDKFRTYYGVDDPEIVVIKATTRQFNPLIDQSFIDAEIERDQEANKAEYNSEFRTDLIDLYQRETIEAAVDPDIRERPVHTGIRYTGFVDPSGGSSDAMTFAIAHREPDGTAVLDLVREFTPPFGIENTVAEIASIAKAYRLPHVWGDAYAGEFAREPFRRNQVIYKLSEKRKNHSDKETQYSKSEIYRDTLPLFNTGKVRWLDNRRLVNQLCSLERQTARGTGRESIDNPRKPGAHDDLANAACGALVFAESKRPLHVHPSVLARSYGAGRSWS